MKAKYKMNKFLKQEFKKTFPLYILGMLFEIITIYITLLNTQIVGNILDMILQGNVSKEQIMQELYRLIFYSAIIFIPNTIKRICYFIVARASDTRIRKEVYHQLQYVKEEYYYTTEKGKLLAYLTKEIPMIRKFLGNFFQSITDLVMTPVLIIIMSAQSINIKLSIILAVIIPITLILNIILYNKKQKKVEEARKEYVKISNIIEENTSNFTLIKLYNNQYNQKQIFEKENEKMKKKDYQVGKIDANIDNIINIAEGICYMATIAYGALLCTRGEVTVGSLTVFVTFISSIFKSFAKRIKEVTDGIVYLKQSVNRFNQIMDIEIYEQDRKEIIDDIKQIKVTNLSYAYKNSTKQVIKNVDLEINKNEKVGIIGMFGSGKTTLMNIISGLYQISENQVYINGIDITKISKYSLFKNISYVLQKDNLINDTIKNNITLETDYQGKKIIQATNEANILEDIFKMKNEFEELVGEKGSKLSGGQKQRITIARNMLVDKDFIILDDVFSALDKKTGKEILNNILVKNDKTIIMISNKVTDVEKLDRIYLMVNGEILASGTHRQLLENNELYREMYEYEMEGEEID
ncbi:MAG: ABC transporter ATP-binding protein [Bacilli bacterium]